MRIVSLLPSATEIVCALGFEENLVGRSHECDYPPAVSRLPALTAPQFKPEGSSLQIDREVKALLERGLSVYRVDVARLKELAPDVIVTQTQCEVCAVSLGDLETALAAWMGNRPALVSLSAVSLAGIWEDIRQTAEALGVAETGRNVVQALTGRTQAIRRRAEGLSPKPRVACIEWLDPLMAAGNWMPELVEAAGGISVLGRAGEHSPWLSWEELLEAKPDRLLILPCGFSLPRVRLEMNLLSGNPNWNKLPAVQRGQVYLTDGNQYFNRPGPRIVESLEILAEILYPEAFSFGHRGTAWEEFE
jgi:iron complex transport system substrate-binding protein